MTRKFWINRTRNRSPSPVKVRMPECIINCIIQLKYKVNVAGCKLREKVGSKQATGQRAKRQLCRAINYSIIRNFKFDNSLPQSSNCIEFQNGQHLMKPLQNGAEINREKGRCSQFTLIPCKLNETAG